MGPSRGTEKADARASPRASGSVWAGGGLRISILNTPQGAPMCTQIKSHFFFFFNYNSSLIVFGGFL